MGSLANNLNPAPFDNNIVSTGSKPKNKNKTAKNNERNTKLNREKFENMFQRFNYNENENESNENETNRNENETNRNESNENDSNRNESNRNDSNRNDSNINDSNLDSLNFESNELANSESNELANFDPPLQNSVAPILQQWQYPQRSSNEKDSQSKNDKVTKEGFNQLQNANDFYPGSYIAQSPQSDSNYELLKKLDNILYILEEQHEEKLSYITEELILYVFLGVFIIFMLDSFVKVGKYSR